MKFPISIPMVLAPADIDSDAPLIAALRANSSWFSLHTSAEITDVSLGGLSILPNLPQSVDYTFSLRDHFGNQTESLHGSLNTPPNKRFFRLKIATP